MFWKLWSSISQKCYFVTKVLLAPGSSIGFTNFSGGFKLTRRRTNGWNVSSWFYLPQVSNLSVCLSLSRIWYLFFARIICVDQSVVIRRYPDWVSILTLNGYDCTRYPLPLSSLYISNTYCLMIHVILTNVWLYSVDNIHILKLTDYFGPFVVDTVCRMKVEFWEYSHCIVFPTPLYFKHVTNSSAIYCGPLSETSCGTDPYVANKDRRTVIKTNKSGCAPHREDFEAFLGTTSNHEKVLTFDLRIVHINFLPRFHIPKFPQKRNIFCTCSNPNLT